jgi:hypothetical protein
MKLQLNDEKVCVDPWSHIDTFEGWTVLTETIVLGGVLLIAITVAKRFIKYLIAGLIYTDIHQSGCEIMLSDCSAV